VEELFGEALHFPVNGEDEAVNGLGIEKVFMGGNSSDGVDSLAIAELCESVQDEAFVDWKAFESSGIVGDDKVGDFRLRGIELQREHMGRA
jgi:hypothetical protein